MKKNSGIAFAIAAVCAAVIWFAFGRTAAAEAAYPAERFFRTGARRVKMYARAVSGARALVRENRRLADEVEILRMASAENAALAAENARLRDALGFARRPGGDAWIPAPVLGSGGLLGSAHVLRAGRGSLDGVRKGAPVAAPEGLVGIVDEVSPHTATVRLITDPSVSVACEIETPDDTFGRIRGILSGGSSRAPAGAPEATFAYFENPLRVRHLKRGLVIPPRAKIFSSGLGGVFPRGLAAGYLADGTEDDDTGLEREGDVIPAVDFPSLEAVFIRREK